MIWTVVAGLSLAIWTVLIFARHGFWLARERDTRDVPADPKNWPDVVAVVPARDEADVIARSIGSLAAQDYPGRFRIVLMDDSCWVLDPDALDPANEATGVLAVMLRGGCLFYFDGETRQWTNVEKSGPKKAQLRTVQ